jgi:hypothetical protein
VVAVLGGEHGPLDVLGHRVEPDGDAVLLAHAAQLRAVLVQDPGGVATALAFGSGTSVIA